MILTVLSIVAEPVTNGTRMRTATTFMMRELQMKLMTNPVEALVSVGQENSDLHEEMAKCYAELDLYRDALTKISKMTHSPPAANVALAALAQRRISA